MRTGYYALLAFALCGHVNALEASAGADTINTSQVGINAKIDASNSLLEAAVNGLTQRIKTCSSEPGLYAPGQTGADAQGCVPSLTKQQIIDILGQVQIKTTTTHKTVAVPVRCSAHSQCSVSFNVASYIPADATGIVVNYTINAGRGMQMSLASSTSSAASGSTTYWSDSDSGEGASWSCSGGKVTLTAKEWNTGGNTGVVSGISIQYSETLSSLVMPPA